jgi:hypothetical protein
MTRPHCSDPSRCSQCLGAQPRTVTLVGGVNYVDGVPVAKHISPHMRGSQRGGQATKRKVSGRKRAEL